MTAIDAVFWWTGAVVAFSACVSLASLLLYGAAMLVKEACNAWWDRALAAYRIESVRHYIQVMINNGRTGLLKEVANSAEEKKEREKSEGKQ